MTLNHTCHTKSDAQQKYQQHKSVGQTAAVVSLNAQHAMVPAAYSEELIELQHVDDEALIAAFLTGVALSRAPCRAALR